MAAHPYKEMYTTRYRSNINLCEKKHESISILYINLLISFIDMC